MLFFMVRITDIRMDDIVRKKDGKKIFPLNKAVAPGNTPVNPALVIEILPVSERHPQPRAVRNKRNSRLSTVIQKIFD